MVQEDPSSFTRISISGFQKQRVVKIGESKEKNEKPRSEEERN